LHRTASVVITSSHADGNSTGAYLVDELPATSWQPNPPDPAPWIEVDLPAPALIERIELAAVRTATGTHEPLSKVARVLVPDPSAPGEGWRPLPIRPGVNDRGELVLELAIPGDLPRPKLSRLRL